MARKLRQIAIRYTIPALVVVYLITYARHEQECSFYSMGGVQTEIKSYGAGKTVFENTCTRIREKYEELESRFSDYRAGSMVSQLNAGNLHYPARIPDDMFYVIKSSLDISAQTKGYFDITVRPLITMWKNAEERQKLPTLAEKRAALDLVSYKKIYLNESRHSIAMAQRKMQIDLGGIAKGYMADEAVKIMRRAGIQRGLVNSGGDIVVFDDNEETKPFKIGIQDPSSRGTSAKVEIEQGAIVTSGNYNRYYTINSERFSHIINPRTGETQGCRSITVKAPTGMEADAYATAFCIMATKGLDLSKYAPPEVEVIDLVMPQPVSAP